MRRFKEAAQEHLGKTKRLPKRISLDEYKDDTDAGKFQLIIADVDTHEPIYFLHYSITLTHIFVFANVMILDTLENSNVMEEFIC